MEQIRELADLVAASPLWRLTDEQSVAAVRESAMAVRKVQAVHLAALADLDLRRGVITGGVAGYEARTYVRHQLKRSTGQAKSDLVAAHALRPGADPARGGLPRLGRAFTAGEVSREHVDAALRVIGKLPKALLAAPMSAEDGSPLLDEDGHPMCAGDVIDERITAHAKEYDSHSLARLAQHLMDAIDPDGTFNPETCSKRGLRMHWDHAGMLILRGELDPAAGALFMAVIDHLARPRRSGTDNADDAGDHAKVPDDRSTSQRQHDALIDVVTAAQASGNLGTRGGERPRITLITTPDDLAAAHHADAHHADAHHADDTADGSDAGAPDDGDGADLGTGTHIGPRLLSRFSCDAILQRALLAPTGAILDLGREVRTITPAQRRALHARDRGCIIPGCTVPAAWTEGHHVHWWSDDGPTDISNLALLCARHHTEVHAGTWTLTIRDGIPWVIPPDWIDPRRRPQRNHFHQQTHDMRDLGRQLRHATQEHAQRRHHPWRPWRTRGQNDPAPGHPPSDPP